MKLNLMFATEAQEDMENIFRYYAEHNEVYAVEFYNRIINHFNANLKKLCIFANQNIFIFEDMNRIILLLTISIFALSATAQEDVSKRVIPLPSVNVKTLKGAPFNTKEIDNEGKPIIICFFATWCKPCMIELKAIADEYDDWQEETGVVIYAVSIDDARSSAKVAPLVKGQNWEYEFLLDENSDFKRAMNVGDIPHTFVLNGNKEIVWQHASYSPGVEQEYINVVRKLLSEKQ